MDAHVPYDKQNYKILSVFGFPIDMCLGTDPEIITEGGGNRMSVKATFQPGLPPHIIIITGTPTVPGRDLNPGPLSLETNALLT